MFRPAAKDPKQDWQEVHLPEPQGETTPATAELLAPQLPALLPSPQLPIDESHLRAVEFEALISPIGRLCLSSGQ
ncbi:hypothetical protein ABZ038_13680 [Streptomyces sp. NPDC006349]|uniref:hypothetical protein n=1 Tax=unclassified Streptomyces TaxID=2593676 RepID=UPI003387147C